MSSLPQTKAMHKLLLSTSILALLLSAAASVPVLDTRGRPLLPNTNYYILPGVRRTGGGLTLAGRNHTCPLNVVQDGLVFNKGLPVKFFPVDSSAKTVELDGDNNVVFSTKTACPQSTVWALKGEGDELYVGTGGTVGRPGAGTLSNWFSVRDGGGTVGYKLVFCPGVCSFCRPGCGDIGVRVEGGRRWLGLGTGTAAEFFPVVFQKA